MAFTLFWILMHSLNIHSAAFAFPVLQDPKAEDKFFFPSFVSEIPAWLWDQIKYDALNTARRKCFKLIQMPENRI